MINVIHIYSLNLDCVTNNEQQLAKVENIIEHNLIKLLYILIKMFLNFCLVLKTKTQLPFSQYYCNIQINDSSINIKGH